MKVTVLVAVYNAHAFLRESLESLRRQTLQDWEAICVDDGSTDDSLHVLNDFSARDSRFRVIHLEDNQGQAHARNVGLLRARGDYVVFLDSDDVLSTDALEEMVRVFDTDEQADCVLFRLAYFYHQVSDGSPYPMSDFDSMTGEEAFEASLTWKIHGIYGVRRSIHECYPYDETCHAFSDDNTTRLHYLMSRKVRTCKGIYYYRQHASSVTHAVDVRRFDYLEANASMKRQMVGLHVSNRLMDIYENERWLNVVDLYWFFFSHKKYLKSTDRICGLDKIRQAWESIEVDRLRPALRRKFGYIPMKGHWLLFRLEEECYFRLRNLLWCLGRERKRQS